MYYLCTKYNNISCVVRGNLVVFLLPEAIINQNLFRGKALLGEVEH